VIKELIGKDTEDPKEYTNPESDKYKAMVNVIREKLHSTSLNF
jgi:hypothetical protein